MAVRWIGGGGGSSAMEALWMDDPRVGSLLAETPKTKDNQYCVFVTYSNGGEEGDDDDEDATVVVLGQSEISAHHAMKRAYNQIRIPSNYNTNNDNYFIKVDAVMSVESMDRFNYAVTEIPSTVGLAIGGGDWKKALLFLPEQVRGYALLDDRGLLRWDHIGKVWAKNKNNKKTRKSLAHNHQL
jgi:hypothetical protein